MKQIVDRKNNMEGRIKTAQKSLTNDFQILMKFPSQDQADTVGCCSLRVEHINLHEEKDGKEFVVEFDFLGEFNSPSKPEEIVHLSS